LAKHLKLRLLMKKLLILISFQLTTLLLLSQGINFFHGSFNEAIEKAKSENKLVFIDCFTYWCGPCKMLQNSIFPLEKVGTFYNTNFICFKVDCEKEAGPDICMRYNVIAYPTMHFIDPSTGKSVYKTMGYQDGDALIEQGKKAMGGNSNLLREYQSKYQNGDKSEDNLYGLVIQLAKNGLPFDAYLKEYLETQSLENLKMEKNDKLIFEMTTTINSPAINYFQGFKQYYIDKYGAESYERRVEQIASKSIKEAGQKMDKQMFASTISFIKNNNISRADEVVLKESMQFYRAINDMVNYDIAATKYIKQYKKNDARFMTEISTIYEQTIMNPKLLVKAVNWMQASTKLESKYYNNIVLAQLYYKLGKHEEAYVMAQIALELGKKENANYWPAQDLINKLEVEHARKN
jgi:thiol-disulfide isomerase/thioredoxin